MASTDSATSAARWWTPAAVLAAAGALLLVATSTGLTQRFLASLRIAKPQVVSAGIPGATAGNGARPLQNVIGGMIAKTVNVVLDEADQPAANTAAATKAAGFPAQLPRARTDSPTITVIGAHTIEMTVDVAQLRTIFVEAGMTSTPLPESAEGSKVVLRTPRALRAQYGNCPASVANTIQGQVQGPLPPSTDNANCIVLVESPAIAMDGPPALDMKPLMDIALELSGMSPVQAQAVPQTLDWKSTLAISLPRNLRSVETKEVNGAAAMLLITAGRRGPTWELAWTRGGLVYALTGYGNSADAIALANSIT
jgi:hypothetical protein